MEENHLRKKQFNTMSQRLSAVLHTKNTWCYGRTKVKLKHRVLTTPLASNIQILLHYKARPSTGLTFLLFNLNRKNKIHYQANDSKMDEYKRGYASCGMWMRRTD